MTFAQFIISYWKYILSGFVSACFLVVNIIQFFNTRDKSKLKDAICRIPEIIRQVEKLADVYFVSSDEFISTTAAEYKSTYKKACAESLLQVEFGERFVKRYIRVLDDAIEDILDTPQKKGGSIDGISKENEER